jgi:hypothetical protein
MGQEWQLIRRLMGLSRSQGTGCITNRPGHGALLHARDVKFLPDVRRGSPGAVAFVPRDFQGIQALLGRPAVIAHDSDHVIEDHDLAHTRYLKRRGILHVAHLAAEYRGGHQHGKFEPLRHCIDPEARAAIDLLRSIHPLQRTTDQDKILRILERRIIGRLDRLGDDHQLAITQSTPRSSVDHLTRRGRQRRRINLQARCGRLHQHGPRPCGGLSQRHPKGAH